MKRLVRYITIGDLVVQGLDHDRNALDTCMNDTLDLAHVLSLPVQSPGTHDADQLGIIYDGHEDSTGGTNGGGGGPDCDKNPKAKSCREANGWVVVHVLTAPGY